MRVTTSRRCPSAGTRPSTGCAHTSKAISAPNVNLHAFFEAFLDRKSACKNANRTPLDVFATRRRGTVAQSNLRLVAGVGVVAVCLLVGGSTAALAIANPGGHGSHSGRGDNNNDNRASNSSSRGGSRGGSDWSDNNGS